MTVAPATKKGQQLAGFAVLAAALLLAAGVAAFFLFTGGEDEDEPADVVRALYDAVEKGDGEAFDALLTPDAREQDLGGLVPFRQTLGEYSPIERDVPPDVTIDEIHEIGREGEWALVGVRGNVLYERARFDLAETIYLRRMAARWMVATEFEFNGSPVEGSTPGTGSDDGLGVLQPQRPKVGDEAPDFALESAYDGSVVKLSDFRGKAVVVNFYASWCEPCKEEIPEFQHAQDALSDQVVFLGVNFAEEKDRALGILQVFQASYPAVLDSNKEVAQHYRATGLPHTVFVDKDGVVRGIRIGLVTPEALEENLAKVGITYSAE